MVDQAAPASWPWTSTVSTDQRQDVPGTRSGQPAARTAGACWDKTVKNIAYGEH